MKQMVTGPHPTLCPLFSARRSTGTSRDSPASPEPSEPSHLEAKRGCQSFLSPWLGGPGAGRGLVVPLRLSPVAEEMHLRLPSVMKVTPREKPECPLSNG